MNWKRLEKEEFCLEQTVRTTAHFIPDLANHGGLEHLDTMQRIFTIIYQIREKWNLFLHEILFKTYYFLILIQKHIQ